LLDALTRRDEEDRPEDDDDALDDRRKVAPERRANAPRDRDMLILTREVSFFISERESAFARASICVVVANKIFFRVEREDTRGLEMDERDACYSRGSSIRA